jgi:hypothetical protein
MALTNNGRNFIASAIIGNESTATFFNSTNSNIGVGDSTTLFDAAQTNLQSAVNKLRKPMDATYPQYSTNMITFQSTFGINDANFAWQEWAIFNGPAAGTMLNRLVEYNGTKQSGQTWVFQVQLSVTAG